MSLVDILTLDDTGSDIHATLAVLNPLVGRRHLGDAMAIITCVTTLHESLYHNRKLRLAYSRKGVPAQCVSVPNIRPRHPPSRPTPYPRNLRSAARPLGEGSRHPQMTAGAPSRRESTGADARPPYEGRSRPPVTPHTPPLSSATSPAWRAGYLSVGTAPRGMPGTLPRLVAAISPSLRTATSTGPGNPSSYPDSFAMANVVRGDSGLPRGVFSSPRGRRNG
jgi:hypothetical protein